MSSASSAAHFPTIEKIKYDPAAPKDNSLVFRHYNATETVMGKSMAEWLRFAVCYWHTFRGRGLDIFGAPTINRAWDDNGNTVENAKRRLDAAFEMMSKLGIQYWTFHDRDISPEGKDLQETNKNLDEVATYAKSLQEKYGIKCLWGTANLFSNPRYMNGAGSNPDAEVYAYAAAQVKKAMEITHFLGGENYVFWGGREGYITMMNTDVRKELDHIATFFHMAIAHKKKIGFGGQLLIEPKPKEPTGHQYDYDAQTTIGFLHTYGLHKDFKLNIEPNHTTMAGHEYAHDVEMASKFGFLGSIDSNTGTPSLGWDTDQFPMELKNCALVMLTVLRQGGLGSGGLNFDCKVRRESTDPEDMFISHIGSMDCFALALRKMAALVQDGIWQKMIEDRYSSYTSGLGLKITKSATSFDELERHVMEKKGEEQEPKVTSGKQEKFEALFNRYIYE